MNGDGLGKNKYMSLFFIIMWSQYDALLTWPFRQKVTFMLLDQESAGEHVVDAFTHRPIPNEPWKYGSQRFLDMAKELNAKGMDYSILKQMAGDTFTIVEKMM